MKPKVLVTSTTGKTGSAAVRQLLEKDYPVRAFVRRKDKRARSESAWAKQNLKNLSEVDIKLGIQFLQEVFPSGWFRASSLVSGAVI